MRAVQLPLVVLGVLISLPAWAQAELIVVSRDLEQGEIGAVRVRVRGARPTAPPRIPVQPESGLNLTFQSQGQDVRIVNGSVSRMYQYTYGVEALEPGTYTIGPAQIEIGTTQITTGSGSILVKPRLGTPSGGVQAQAGFDVDEAWVGQVVMYRRSLRSSDRILRDSWTDPPFRGLVPPRDGDAIYADYAVQGEDGPTWIKEEYHPKIVTDAGTREVPAAVARVTTAAKTGGRPSPFTRGRSKTEVFPVKASKLVVRELPPAPAGFTGLIGSFSFDSRLERTEAPVGASINQEIIVRGSGTLERFSLPRPDGLDGVRVYEGTAATRARVDSDGYKAEGRFPRVLVPTRPGRVEVPPMELITFDPELGEYVTHVIETPTLRITKGQGGASEFESFVGEGAFDTDLVVVEEPYEGVREVRASGWVAAPWMGGLLPWALVLAGSPLLALGSLVGGRGASRLARQLAKPRTPKVRDVTPRQRLSQLPSDPLARLAELDAAVRHALARRVGQSVESLDRDTALQGLPDDLAEHVRNVTRRLDRARFGGGAGDGIEDEVRQVVSRLEARS